MSILRTACSCFLLWVLGTAVTNTSSAQQTAATSSAPPMAREEVTRILANNRKIVSPDGIEELAKVRIGGIDQWISIRGKDRRNPIMLVLHGGPASPIMPLDYTYQTPWEDYFTVVQWDQRGTAKTYASNTEQQMAPGMTIDGMTDDAVQVVEYLREHYNKRKIFLMGHSWGTVLGVHLVQRRPDWFYAYIGVGQVVNFLKNEEIGYNFALSRAKADNNAEAVHELESIAPYPGTASLTIERIVVRSKWEMHYGGLAFGRSNYNFDADAESLSPDYSQSDVAAVGGGSVFSLNYLMGPMATIDFSNVTTFGCPVILLIGQHDYTTSHELAEKWFQRIKAPSKHLVVFADSAHMVMQEQPGRFLVHLVTDALPLAQKAGDAAPAEVIE
jgi:pimeloyl-ACP methyl ester carboxylesterase